MFSSHKLWCKPNGAKAPKLSTRTATALCLHEPQMSRKRGQRGKQKLCGHTGHTSWTFLGSLETPEKHHPLKHTQCCNCLQPSSKLLLADRQRFGSQDMPRPHKIHSGFSPFTFVAWIHSLIRRYSRIRIWRLKFWCCLVHVLFSRIDPIWNGV